MLFSFGIAKVDIFSLPPNFFATFFEKIVSLYGFRIKNGIPALKIELMDIDLLSKMVKELILDNDRVVLPGLGAFVAEIVPSTFSDKGYTINPPYRRMYFRSRPSEGSDLAELYAKANDVEISVAERIIGDFVQELKTVLLTRKAVALPGLGRLRATKENNIFFVADEDLDIYPEGFGLEPVSLKTHQETREEVAAVVVDLKSILKTPSETDVLPETETLPAEEAPMADARVDDLTGEVLPEESPAETPAEPDVAPAEPEEASAAEVAPALEVAPSEPEESPAAEEVPAIDETPSEEPETESLSAGKKSDVKKTLWVILGTIIAVILILLAALAILGRTNPELIDSLLYTPEELKILNQIL